VNTYKNTTQLRQSWPWWRWILTGLNTLALVLSVILSWHYLIGGSMVGCGGGSPCDQVLNSQWSTIAGKIPLSGLAVGVSLALLVVSFFIGPATEASIKRLAWSVMLILAGSVAGSAVWFTILQKWEIGAFCPYCMTTHITGLLLAALVIWRATREFNNSGNNITRKNQTIVKNITPTTPSRIFRPLTALGLSLAGLALAGILAVCQVVLKPSAVYRDGQSLDNLPVFDYKTVPIAGSPEAPYIVKLLFDYNCPHCQKLHFILNEAIRRYNGKLAFVLCPSPLNSSCNQFIPFDIDAYKNSCELARIALTVWVASRETFPAFENWMFTFESGNNWQSRSLESTRAKGVELVGQARFDAAWSDPWIGNYIQNCVQIYGQTVQDGKGGVPKLIFGSRWVIPELNSADDLVMILQNSLAVPKP
jgi:uncharacterized membrane protein